MLYNGWSKKSRLSLLSKSTGMNKKLSPRRLKFLCSFKSRNNAIQLVPTNRRCNIITMSKMIRVEACDPGTANVEGEESLSLVNGALLKKHDDEHSLTSASTEAPSDSEYSGETRDIADKETLAPPKLEKADKASDCKAPALTDLSFSAEEDEGRLELQQQHNTVDRDEDSLASSSTLLSDLSSIEEKPELDRLEDDFELRDELIKKFVVVKDPKHLKIVKDYEALMRKALRDHYEQQAVKEHTKRLKRKTRSKRSQSTLVNRVNDTLLFRETARGFASIVLYCIAHLSCWEITTVVLYELTQHYENQSMVHAVFLLTSLVMLRVSGGIFGWLDPDTYEEAQTSLHGRSVSLDTRIMKWFRRRPNIKAVVNMLAFYICWTAVAYYQNRGLHMFDKRETVAQGLPSYHHHDVVTSAKERLVSGLDYEEEALEFEARDYAYLMTELSVLSLERFMGDEYASIVSTNVTILFFAVAAAVSIAILRFSLGHTFEV